MELKEGYKQTEVGAIPDEWQVESLGNLAQIQRGASPRPIDSPVWYDSSSTVGWVRISDVTESNGIILTKTQDYLSQQGIEQSRFLPANSLIMSICASVGIPIITSIDVCIHDGFVGFTKLTKVDKTFLYYKIKDLEDSFKSMGQTGSQSNLNTNLVYNCLIALPPLCEQHAIATALTEIDTLLTSLNTLIIKKRNIKQATMHQLLTGRIRLPGFNGKWEERKLGEIAEIDSDNLNSNTPLSYIFKYVSLEDVHLGMLKGFSEMAFRDAPSRARRRTQKNDILVSTVRPNLKSHLHISDDIPDLICSTGFTVLRCSRGISDSKYVYFHLFAEIVGRQIESLLTGSNYPAINSNDVRMLKIPFPILQEQQAIAAVLSDMDAEIVTLEQKRDKIRVLKQGMMQELLTGKTRLL